MARADLFDRGEKLLDPDRFGDISVHSCPKAALFVSVHGMSGNREYGHVDGPVPLTRPNGSSCLQSINVRHLHIEQSQIEPFSLENQKRFPAVAGNDNLMSVPL